MTSGHIDQKNDFPNTMSIISIGITKPWLLQGISTDKEYDNIVAVADDVLLKQERTAAISDKHSF